MLHSGDHIGDWVVESPLGADGVRSVWRCRSRHAPLQLAAVKVLRGGEASQQYREASALTALSHPGVARVLECWRDAERECLLVATALVEGMTLRERLRGGALPAVQARVLAREGLEALDAVHRAGVCHRDLKPANIMLRPDGAPVLVAFGTPWDRMPHPRSRGALSISSHIAPECLRPGDVDPVRVDLYALGVSLFEALTGSSSADAARAPRQHTLPTAAREHPGAALDPGASAPVALRVLIRALTQPVPSHRPSSAAAALSLLHAPAAIRGAGRANTSQPPRSRRWAWLVLLAALAGGTWAALQEEAPVPLKPVLSGVRLPKGERLLETESTVLLGIPHGAVEPLADRVGQGLLEDGWRMTEDRSHDGISVELYEREGRHLGVLVSTDGPAAFVLVEDRDIIDPAMSQLGLPPL
ncbi:MAG: protein kinase [Myxococcota bacterium]|nr:protein kinase [Myxococcota bacterium]